MTKLRRTALLFFAALLFLSAWASARAEILPARGERAGSYQATVLCESLTVRSKRSSSAAAVKTLKYGDIFYVRECWDGWADCYLTDSPEAGMAGWVDSNYIVINPEWYLTEEYTPVYAWNDTLGPRVALLDSGARLPVLKDEGEWLLVSLRGAVGWIFKTAEDRVSQATMDRLRSLSELERAQLETARGFYVLDDPESLRWLEENFSVAQPILSAGCPFDATLTLFPAGGKSVTLRVATDSCRNFLTEDGAIFAYGSGEEALRLYGTASVIGERFWRLFGISDPCGETGQ